LFLIPQAQAHMPALRCMRAMPMDEKVGLNAEYDRELEGKTVLEWVPTSEI
jgi:hypothetical protein